MQRVSLGSSIRALRMVQVGSLNWPGEECMQKNMHIALLVPTEEVGMEVQSSLFTLNPIYFVFPLIITLYNSPLDSRCCANKFLSASMIDICIAFREGNETFG